MTAALAYATSEPLPATRTERRCGLTLLAKDALVLVLRAARSARAGGEEPSQSSGGLSEASWPLGTPSGATRPLRPRAVLARASYAASRAIN